jgi:hypothetical protein
LNLKDEEVAKELVWEEEVSDPLVKAKWLAIGKSTRREGLSLVLYMLV